MKRGRIDVFDATFTPVTLPGRFRDPELPSGFVPFAIHNLQGNLYVSFGKRNADRNFVAPGRGQGIVSVFNANGRFLRRISSGSSLNAPWGMAIAAGPNFGSGGLYGRISATTPQPGALEFAEDEL